MKKVLKKNQVIITALAALIAVAGYLNFADVNLGRKDKEANAEGTNIVEDIDSLDYDLTDETALLSEDGGEDISQETAQSPVEEISSTAGNTSSNGTADGFNPAKQERFEELAQKEQAAREQEWQERQALTSSVESTAPDSSQGAGPQKTTGSGQSPQTASASGQETAESASSLGQIREPVSAGQNAQKTAEPARNFQQGASPVQDSIINSTSVQSIPNSESENYSDNSSSGSPGNSGNISQNNFSAYNPPEDQDSMPTGEMVWLSATGKKYYSIDHCGNMNPQKAKKVSLAYAIKEYGKCENCW